MKKINALLAAASLPVLGLILFAAPAHADGLTYAGNNCHDIILVDGHTLEVPCRDVPSSPEPATLILIGSGLGAMALKRFRSKS